MSNREPEWQAVAHAGWSPPLAHAEGRTTPLDPECYRSLFPILRSKIHLANCSQGPLSTLTMDALDDYERTLLELGMDWDDWMERVRQAKEAFAALIGTSAENVAVLSSVSDTVSSVASCLPIRGRTRVVTTVDEFPTVGHAWLAGTARGRDDVAFVTAPNGIFTPELLEPFLRNDAAILSVHLVSYYNAVLQDIRGLTEVAHEHGALIFVDAYQGLGTVPLDVDATGVDIVVSGNLKYLLGLPGIAFMYVRPGIVEDLTPAMTGWFGRVNPFSFDATELDYAPDARRFDMGTPPIPAAYAATPGMRLIAEIGVPEIQRHVQDLSRVVIDEALKRGLEIASPLDVEKKGAATAIRVGGALSPVIEQEMLKRGVIVSARADVIRLAPHFFSTREDVIDAIQILDEVLTAR